MAKAKKKAPNKPSKNKVEKIARQAGKIAAQAERIARDAVDKAVQASAMVVDVVGHPSHAVEALGGAVSAGRETVGKLGSGAQGLIESGTSAIANSSVVDQISSLIDERLKATISSLGLATNAEVAALKAKIRELESGGQKALPPARARAAKAAAKKPAAKPAAKKAAAKPAAKPAAKKPAAKKA